MSKTTIFSVSIIGTVIAGIFFVDGLFLTSRFYPYLVISGPEELRIHFLQPKVGLAPQCSRSLASQIAAIQSSCPSCQIEKSLCLGELDSVQQHWLTDLPIDSPSARMSYGVVVFQSPHIQTALLTCQAAEIQSQKNTFAARVRCFPEGTRRPLSQFELDTLAKERTEKYKLFGMALASVIGLITLVVASQAILRRLALREPMENTSTEANIFQPEELKLSNILKRVSDIFLAVAILTALLPVLFVAALMIRILEGAPVFYVSRRFISLDKSITIYKFRTMVKDATSPKYQLRERFMRDGYLDIPLECEVYTSIGRFLERTQLVETLQLLNILFDGMSFVGNRPLPKDNIDLLRRFEGWQERFDSPAGITGISQIVGKYGLLPHQRLYLERLYSSVYKSAKGNIVLCDLYIIAYTVLLLLTGRYLNYDKAIAILVRCGADKYLAGHVSCDPAVAEAMVQKRL